MATSNYFLGGNGDDVIDRLVWVDAVQAGGGAGSDILLGGGSNDHLFGNSPDAVAGAIDGDDRIFGGAGNDYLQGNAGDDELHGGDGNDRIYGGAGEDDLQGGDGHDHLQGNRGSDELEGGTGNDTLRGGADNDELDGGVGNDQLLGDNGDDELQGGLGVDRLTGGVGRDTFEYDRHDALIDGGTSFAQADTITDFAAGQDEIDLDFDVEQVLTATGQSFADISAAQAYATQLLTGDAGTREVAAVGVGSDTWLFFSSNGGDAVDSAIQLANVQPVAIGTPDFD
jgi:serralysin